MKKLIILMLTVTAGYGIANAQQPGVVVSDKAGWHKIAETMVDLKKERDDVMVIGADKFASIKLKITDAAVNISSLVIYFEKGDSQSVAISAALSAPGESRVIDLKNGAERSINKISFVYKTLPNRKEEKAHVEIWGLKTNADKSTGMDKDKKKE
jgi:hypothetical protein